MAKLDGIKVVNENTLEYNGFVYGLTKEKANRGDLIQCLEEDAVDLTYGAFYQVIDTDSYDDMQFLDDDNDERERSVTDENYKVFRKSHAITSDKLTDAEGVVKIELPDGTKLEGTPSDLEKITRSMKALQNEQQGQAEQVATVEMPEETVEVEDEGETVSERLQVGDYVKVVAEDEDEYEVGDIVRIIEVDGSSIPYQGERLSDSLHHWLYKTDVVKATNEEVLEAKQALLKVNDYARVISNAATTEACGPHEFEVGTVLKLHEFDSDDNIFETRYLNGDTPDAEWVHRKDLEPLTAEEAEHIAREAEEEKKAKPEREEKETERLKWAAIGREVGEIKDGDVVKVIDKGSSEHKIGDVGEVSDSSKCLNGQYSFKVNTESLKFVNWLGSESVELIVPVEQRFDTVG